jgi:hypothetical protein
MLLCNFCSATFPTTHDPHFSTFHLKLKNFFNTPPDVSKDTKRSPCKEDKWKSLGAKSAEYGSWGVELFVLIALKATLPTSNAVKIAKNTGPKHKIQLPWVFFH